MKKRRPSNISNCEVKMFVICVHGMLAGTSKLANRHDFWGFYHLRDIFFSVRLFDLPQFWSRKNILYTFRKCESKCRKIIIRESRTTEGECSSFTLCVCVNICSSLRQFTLCFDSKCVNDKLLLVQQMFGVNYAYKYLILNFTHLNHERLISISISLHHFLNA